MKVTEVCAYFIQQRYEFRLRREELWRGGSRRGMEGADAKVAAEGGSGGFKEVGEFTGGLLAMWKGKLEGVVLLKLYEGVCICC